MLLVVKGFNCLFLLNQYSIPNTCISQACFLMSLCDGAVIMRSLPNLRGQMKVSVMTGSGQLCPKKDGKQAEIP